MGYTGYIKTEDGQIKLKFGQFKNKTLDEISSDYIQWMVRQHADKGNFDEYLIIKCEKELKIRNEKIPYVYD